jgi:hypothetical protein
MYMVLTQDIITADNQECLFARGDIIPLDYTLGLASKYLGIDNLLGYLCTTLDVAESIQRSMEYGHMSH